jgi:hypothetical protein
MVSAQADAISVHAQVLKDAGEEIKKAQEAAFGLAMLALSMVAGPVMHWIGSSIEFHWFPKYTGKLKERTIHISSSKDGWWNVKKIQEVHHNEVWAKVFGDVAHDGGHFVIDKSLERLEPDSKLLNEAENATDVAASSSSWDFKRNLENAMSKQASVTMDQIMSWANRILEDRRGFGQAFLQKVYQRNPRLKDARKEFLQDQGEALIVEEIDAKRSQWANSGDWFYYANDPPATTKEEIRNAMEIELWALWILNQELRIEVHNSGDPILVDNTHYYTVSKTFGRHGVPDPVLRHLIDFGVVQGRTREERREEQRRWMEMKERQERQDDLKNQKDLKDANHLFTTRKPYTKEELDRINAERNSGPRVIDMEAERRARKENEDRKIKRIQAAFDRDAELNSVHPATADRPVIDVGSQVDTQGEIDALESWAKKHPLALSAARLSGYKRTLGSIKDIYNRR